MRHYDQHLQAVSDYERRELAALAREQITHPVNEYQQGSPKLERLYDAIAQAQRFQWPSEGYVVNL